MRDVVEAFGLGSITQAPEPGPRGVSGQIWRVETSGGVFAVKQLFREVHPSELSNEMTLVARALGAGLATPMPISTLEGEIVWHNRYRVNEWVDLDQNQEWTEDRVRESGRLLAALHAVAPATDAAMSPWLTTCLHDWDALKADVLLDELPHLRALEQIATDPPPRPTHLCHSDFLQANLAFDAAGRCHILDWERTGPHVFEREVAYAAPSSDFIAGYREAGGTFAPSGLDVFSAAIFAYLNFLGIQAQASTPWSRQVVQGLLAAPMRVELLECRLEAWSRHP